MLLASFSSHLFILLTGTWRDGWSGSSYLRPGGNLGNGGQVQQRDRIEGAWITEDFMEQNWHKSSGLLASELLLEREINFYFVEGTVILDPVTKIIPTDRLLWFKQPSFMFICFFSSKLLVTKITSYIYLCFVLYFYYLSYLLWNINSLRPWIIWYSVLYPYLLQEGLAHNRCLINICAVNWWVNTY